MSKQRTKYAGHHIEQAWCKGCGICVEFCPKQVLALNTDQKATVVHPENCICCRLCELRCPDLAIEVVCIPQEAVGHE